MPNPGCRPNLTEDFVLEGELRGTGTIGLFWNGQEAPGGYEKTLGRGLSRSQHRADGTWTLPEALPADVGTRADFGIRNVSYCLDASGLVLLHSAVLAADPLNAPNDTEANKARNRRVEFVVVAR